MLSKEQNAEVCDPSTSLRLVFWVNCDPSLASPAAGGIAMTPLWTGLLNREQEDERSVATDDHSSTVAGNIIIISSKTPQPPQQLTQVACLGGVVSLLGWYMLTATK